MSINEYVRKKNKARLKRNQQEKQQKNKDRLHLLRDRQYCKNCKRTVKVNRWTIGSTFIFILLLALGLIPGFIYLIWKIVKIGNRCPICRDDNFR